VRCVHIHSHGTCPAVARSCGGALAPRRCLHASARAPGKSFLEQGCGGGHGKKRVEPASPCYEQLNADVSANVVERWPRAFEYVLTAPV
jgi:hypothetical protein